MKARINIKGEEGRYFFHAEGDKVLVSDIEMKYQGREGDWDIFSVNSSRQILIHKDELSWLGDGNFYPIKNFKLREIREQEKEVDDGYKRSDKGRGRIKGV